MGYDNQPRSSSGTVVAIVLLLGLMVLGGLLVVGVGGWFFLSSSSIEPATIERPQEVEVEQRVRAMAEEAADATRTQAGQVLKTAPEFEQGVVDETVPDKQVTIELDKAGQLKLNGEAIELAALLDRLKAFAAAKTGAITVNVRADEECQFRNVAALISTCQELGITRFRFGTLDATIAEEPSDEEEPATVLK